MADLYYANVVSGLEGIAAEEITRVLPASVVSEACRGRVSFTWDGPPEPVLSLRTVLDVFAHVADLQGISPARDGLDQITALASGLDLTAALRTCAWLRQIPADPSFRATGTREGTHEYNSVELAGFAGAGIAEATGWRVDLTGHDLDLWFEVRDGRLTVGLRLSTDELSRRSRVAHGVAATNPTVAHAMCLLIGAGEDDVFLDPMCGSGTVLVERGLMAPAARIIGVDRDAASLHMARQNLAAASICALVAQGDGRSLSVRDAAVDCIVSDLPWGHRVGSHRANRRLYPAFMAEAVRVLRPGGRMALLTAERRLSSQVMEAQDGLRLGEVLALDLGGLGPAIYVLTRES